MDTTDKVLAIAAIVVFVIVAVIAWNIVGLAQLGQAETAALDACWQCGWGRVERVQDEYRCLILEDGGESVRTIEWVQENACNVLER